MCNMLEGVAKMNRDKKLYKSETNKKIAGVCGGIAEYFEIEPSIVRIIWFVITWFYGIGVAAYIACALILPTESEAINSAVERAARREAEAANPVTPEAEVVEFTVDETYQDEIPE